MNRSKQINSFTLIEMLIVIAILGILFAMLVPQLAKSKQHAEVVVCMGNLRQVALAYKNYMHDFEGELPVCEYWLDDFSAIYLHAKKSNEIFTCPRSRKPPWYVWDSNGDLRNGDFLTGGTIEDVEKNGNYNHGKGNNPYHFDPSNPSPQTKAVMASKRSDRIVYEKYWGAHFNGLFFNVVHISDLHYEKEKNGIGTYWTLDDRGWIDTSLDPYPEDMKMFDKDSVPSGGGGGGGGGLGDCTLCGGDGVKSNGKSCGKCGGDGWL